MKPCIALSNPQEQCLTFFWNEMRGYFAGYRLVEGQPRVSEKPLLGYKGQPAAVGFDLPRMGSKMTERPPGQDWKNEWQVAYSEQNPQAPIQLSFHLSDEGIAHAVCIENDGQQRRELHFQPVSHGVRMWITLTTREAIRGSYCLQQCLRLTGMFNAEWRQVVAHMPFLSEFDMQAMGNANGTLTFARRDNRWLGFPVQHVIYPTQEDAANPVGPPGDLIDHGLIVRETASRELAPASYWERVAPDATWQQFTCAMFWERTACVSNRHPADCVHAWVDFGPLSAGQSRTLRGAVYFIEGSKDDLLPIWEADFKLTD